MSKLARQFQKREWLYRMHTLSALIAAAWLLLLAISGVLINHQETLGLTEWEISDSYLPGYYRPEYRTGATRANVILTDLHSGRIFGDYGALLGDGIALLIVFSVITGLLSHRLRKKLLKTSLNDEAIAPSAPAMPR